MERQVKMSKNTVIKYIILNVFMPGFTVLTLFTQPLSSIAFFVLATFVWGGCFSVPLFLFVNWLAYRFVDDNIDERRGVIFAALGGFIGGFVAVHTQNKDYSKKRTINVIFNIWLYAAVIYPIMVGILFLTGYYSML